MNCLRLPCAAAAALVSAFVAGLAAADVQLISEAQAGGSGSAASERPAITKDGRIVAFESLANDLVPGDTNGARDIFVADVAAGTLAIVSINDAGFQANGASERASLSGDGRLVAFRSAATNLVPGDTNGAWDIFVHDRITGLTTRVSVASGGGQANGNSDTPSMAADGRYVAFQSTATNLVPGDTNNVADVFVHDLFTGVTERVSVSTGGLQGSLDSDWPGISADGRFVVFASASSTLAPTGPSWDVFRRDRVLGVTEAVTFGSGDSRFPSISATGQRISFQSVASNLVPNDTNGVQDVFLFDYATGLYTRISVSNSGGQANGPSFLSRISSNGAHVAFRSAASNLVPGDTNGVDDVFLRSPGPGTTKLVSVGDQGQLGNGFASRPDVSTSGAAVAFESQATNLVPDDTNGVADVFRWTRDPLCWHVDSSAAGTGNGSPANPFSSLQAAVDSLAVIAGDCLLVQPGIYAESVELGGKALDIEGVGGAAVTIVDAGGSGPVFSLSPASGTTRLAGLTLTGGSAHGPQYFGDGGGIYAVGADLQIEGCEIVENGFGAMPSRGGGIFALDLDLTLRDTLIAGNQVGGSPVYGGGLFLRDGSLTAERLTIRDHMYTDFGGAAYLENASATLLDCTFENNDRVDYHASRGKAIYAVGAAVAIDVEGCTFRENGGTNSVVAAGAGGGLYLDVATADVRSSLFEKNVVGHPGGGGIYATGATALTVEDVEFRGNDGHHGGGIFAGGSSASVVSSTFIQNRSYAEGAGIAQFGSTLSLEGCLFDGNATGIECYPAGALSGTDLTATDCLFTGNLATDGGAAVVAGATFLRCSFIENETYYCVWGKGFGGAVQATAGTVFERCIFWRNSAATRGGAVYGPAVLDRCTLVENHAPQGGGGAWDAQLDSSIIWANTPNQLAGAATAAYSIVQNAWPGQGNLNVDPDLWLPSVGDMHLAPGSPAIDAGNPFAPLDPDGSRADMGALPFEATYCPTPTAYCTASTSTVGCTAEIGFTGTLTFSGPDAFHVTAQGVTNNKFGTLILGGQPGAIPLGPGTLCIQPPIRRAGLQSSGGSPGGNDCSGSFDFELQPSFLATLFLGPGDEVFTQWWYRDPQQAPPQDPIALSNALAIGICP